MSLGEPARPNHKNDHEMFPHPSPDQRFTDDRRSHHVPACCADSSLLVHLLKQLRAYRRAAENLVIAEANFDARRISERSLARRQAQYEEARAQMLAADKYVRIELP